MTDEELLTMRLSIVHRIVSLCGDIGKTKIQKITYFLQEAVGVPVMYPFRMHYYGPYSDELDGVVSLAQMLGYIEIKPDPDGFGYHVTKGSESTDLPSPPPELSDDLEESMDRATETLGALETAKLELYATIHFIGRSRGNSTRDEVLKTVQSLKPKFSEKTITRAYSELGEAGLSPKTV